MPTIKATAKFKDILVSGLDTDAITFLDAASITDIVIRSAISAFVTELKLKDVWDFIEVLYPIVGGDATKHSFNLKRPEKFQITWVNNPTHSSTGVDYNGTTQYGKTGFDTNASRFVSGNSHGGVYHRETIEANFRASFGARRDTGDFIFSMEPRVVGNFANIGINGQVRGTGGSTVTDGTGFLVMNRDVISPDHYNLFRNGLEVADITPDPRGDRSPEFEIYLGATNREDVVERFGNLEASLYSFGDTLSDQQHLDYYNAIQTLQTALGRNV